MLRLKPRRGNPLRQNPCNQGDALGRPWSVFSDRNGKRDEQRGGAQMRQTARRIAPPRSLHLLNIVALPERAYCRVAVRSADCLFSASSARSTDIRASVLG